MATEERGRRGKSLCPKMTTNTEKGLASGMEGKNTGRYI